MPWLWRLGRARERVGCRPPFWRYLGSLRVRFPALGNLEPVCVVIVPVLGTPDSAGAAVSLAGERGDTCRDGGAHGRSDHNHQDLRGPGRAGLRFVAVLVLLAA